MNGHDGVAVVVLAGELHPQLDFGDLLLELADDGFDVGLDVLPLPLQFQQNVELLGPGVERGAGLHALLGAAALTAYVLRFFGIVPEAGSGHLALDLVERMACGSGVKDSSGPRAVWGGGCRCV